VSKQLELNKPARQTALNRQ